MAQQLEDVDWAARSRDKGYYAGIALYSIKWLIIWLWRFFLVGTVVGIVIFICLAVAAHQAKMQQQSEEDGKWWWYNKPSS